MGLGRAYNPAETIGTAISPHLYQCITLTVKGLIMAFYFNSNQNDISERDIEVYLNPKNRIILNFGEYNLDSDDYEYLTMDFSECLELKNQLDKVIEHFVSLIRQ